MTIPRIAPYDMTQQTLPSNRVAWSVDPARCALLVHDMQDYFLAFFDQDSAAFSQVILAIQQLIAQCRARGVPIFYTAQPTRQSAAERGLLQDFWGDGLADQAHLADVYAAIKPQPEDIQLTKWRYSAFKRSTFREELSRLGRDQLLICGVYTHIGCLQTAAEAFMLDVQPFLIADGTADFSLDQHLMALNYVASCCGMVITCQEALQGLAGQSRGSMRAGAAQREDGQGLQVRGHRPTERIS